MSRLQPGEILDGRYRVVRALGQGGMGEVFEAEQMQLGRRVVLKTVRPERAGEGVVDERLLREARAAAALQHPNVVTVHEVLARGDEAVIVMEAVAGEVLRDAMRRQPAAPLAVAVAWTEQILAGLAAAHARGVVHRDLKPTNLIVTDVPGLGPLVKILDFGLAHFVDRERHRRLTQTGQILGTPGYMAPEQVQGGPIDARTDLFAVGVLLFRMLTGRLPWEAPSPAERLAAMIEQPPTPLNALRPDLPPEVHTLVHRAIERDPARRFESAEEMLEALRGLGTPVVAAVDPPARRRRGLVLAAAIALVLAAGSAASAVVVLRAVEGPRLPPAAAETPATAETPAPPSVEPSPPPMMPMTPLADAGPSSDAGFDAGPSEAASPEPTGRARATRTARGDPRVSVVVRDAGGYPRARVASLYRAGGGRLADCLEQRHIAPGSIYYSLEIDASGRVTSVSANNPSQALYDCGRDAYVGRSLAGPPGWVAATVTIRRR